jgi:hypothetical protein
MFEKPDGLSPHRDATENTYRGSRYPKFEQSQEPWLGPWPRILCKTMSTTIPSCSSRVMLAIEERPT